MEILADGCRKKNPPPPGGGEVIDSGGVLWTPWVQYKNEYHSSIREPKLKMFWRDYGPIGGAPPPSNVGLYKLIICPHQPMGWAVARMSMNQRFMG
jgi:hypothetical protein